MKKILSIFSALALVLMIASCSKSPSKVLPRKDGKWKYTYTETENGKTSNGAGTMTFTDSNFTLTDDALSSISITGTWSYDKSSENITLTVGSDATKYKVTDMTRSSETWTLDENNSTTVIKLTKA